MTLTIAIRGAGAAGLSLAQALLHQLPGVAISVFDQRERLPHPQRTFCFFADSTAICPVPPACRWNEVVLSGPDFHRTLDCHETPYSLTRGQDFFSTLLHNLESRGVRFHWGCPEVAIHPGEVRSGGISRRFDYVIDAAFRPAGQSAILWQSFAGIWVKSTKAIFNPEQALLMDLQGCDPATPLRFAYLLPTSPYTALVEHTVFSPQPQPRAWHLEGCREWLARRGFDALEEVDSEYGAIPLGLKTNTPTNSVLRVGSVGGAVRASTGYAFQTIQHQVAALAGQIANAGLTAPRIQPSRPFPAWLRLADRLFLEALARAPARGTMMMQQLLRQAPERELLRFLSGHVTLWEALRVMVNVPKVAMIRSLCVGDS